MSTPKTISDYLASIGRRGGRKSKRYLSTKDAREMVKLREAKKAYKKYYSLCFWSFDPGLKISKEDIKWVAEQLMKNGPLECWKIGKKLCQ